MRSCGASLGSPVRAVTRRPENPLARDDEVGTLCGFGYCWSLEFVAHVQDMDRKSLMQLSSSSATALAGPRTLKM